MARHRLRRRLRRLRPRRRRTWLWSTAEWRGVRDLRKRTETLSGVFTPSAINFLPTTDRGGSATFRRKTLRSVGRPRFCAAWRSATWTATARLDLLTTTVGGAAHLYRNIAPKRGHWLLVRAIDPALRRDAYGAEIAVVASDRRRVGWINPGQSYLCSSDCRAHFGLGAADAVDAIEVLWPDGVREVFPGRPADQVVVLRKGEGKPL